MSVTTAPMPRRSKDPTEPVRLKADLAHKIGIICAHLGVGAAELLDEALRDFIEQKYREVAKEIAEDAKHRGPTNGHGKKP